ncbi:MAG: hypothetical protein J6V82_00780 [Clostridia bacterium]|nr:hypothetical protein [Clostridia bacterium]
MLKNLTLEMSLKPFKKTDTAYVEQVCRKLFTQWAPLCEEADMVSVLLWVGDGSEILEYKGHSNEPFEWGKYAGGCNSKMQTWNPNRDPGREGLHTRTYLYTENPPEMTYDILRSIIGALKRIGSEVLGGKTIRVGETFDPGPEFANSEFKYTKHPELCLSDELNYMNSFICSYATLHRDTEAYAGFPEGIPEGLPFGTYLGRQCQHFLTDMGFDYLWLSNGFGFGRDTWSTTGAVFDGKEFRFEESAKVRKIVLDFWTLFRKECPKFPIETRGTNMSVGIDYAKDGVPLHAIYKGGFNMLPPPNSPWAALDGDFGLEIMGYLSRIAELPDDKQNLFRFYVHDPWWVNSPWYDRYQGQPHDIYMPLSCARIDKKGKIGKPTHMNLLTVDTTFGELPDQCAREAIPHILKGLKDAPDAPAPVVWVYPFREYCETEDPKQMNHMFGGDWFVRGAINLGFPLSCVISTDNFVKVDKSIFSASTLFTPTPLGGSAFENAILRYIQSGGNVIFYGRLDHTSAALREAIGVNVVSSSTKGDLPLVVDGKKVGKFRHDELLCAGKINTVAQKGTTVIAKTGKYAICTVKGNVAWIRGSLSSDYVKGQRLLVPQDSEQFYPVETLALRALAQMGWDIRYENKPGQRSPMLILSRSDNAVMLSSYLHSTTAKTYLRGPLGAPVPIAHETVLEGGFATYHFAKAEHSECRVFVDGMQEGVVRVKEVPPVSVPWRRRITVFWIKNATVRFFAEDYCKDNIKCVLDSHIDEYILSKPFDGRYITDKYGTYYEVRNVTGSLTFSMPRKNYKPQPINEKDNEVNIDNSSVPNYL